MSFAIKNTLVAVPALVTLFLGLVFIVLVFVLVIRAISVMPLLRKALKIYVVKNSAYKDLDNTPEKKSGLGQRLINIFTVPDAGGKPSPKNYRSDKR